MIRVRWIFIFFIITALPGYLFPFNADEEEPERNIYEIVRYGTIDDLKAECRRRGIIDEGDELTLKRRLLKHELESTGVPFDDRLKEITESDIILNRSEFIEYWEGENGEDLLWLHGDVDVVYAGKKIQADEVKINLKAGIITGSGNVVFIDEKGQKYLAESFYYNADTDEGLFFNARTSLDTFIYSGDIIRQFHDGEKFEADNVSLSTCNLENPHYRVDAEKLYYYEEGRILIKDASLYYGSDSILRLPYFYKRMEERPIKSSLYFRERSGIVVQNTYTSFKTDETELVLKGDYYERLGIYTGADYFLAYPAGETTINASAALAKDIYRYDDVTEEWSPLGPPDSTKYSVNRSLRYKGRVYQKFQFGEIFRNEAELNLEWPSDPYYDYDFERRSMRFDPFQLIGQAEYDFPRKGNGFSWYLNDYITRDSLSISVQNDVHFEPQRNLTEKYVSLPDYYEYRLYTLTAPSVALTHSRTIFNDIAPEIFSDIQYTGRANYMHTIYYDENAVSSSEVHKAGTSVGLSKDYDLAEYIRFSPGVELGALGQYHVDASSGELSDDRTNTLVYGRTEEGLTFGSSNLYLKLNHNLKYKLFGPDDYYTYGRFRIHEIGLKGYVHWWYLTDAITTSYDLRQTYDWDAEQYEPLTFDKSRFTPLVNDLTFAPFSALTLRDILVYDIASSEFKTNSFSLNFSNSYLFSNDREITAGWLLDWEHNFINPVLDNLSSIFSLTARVHPYWLVYFWVQSRNDDIWRYIPKSARERGQEPVNPVVDLLKSFNFFNVEDRKESYFKMKSLSLGLIHDLHDWELKFDYTGNRELSYEGSRYLWNNTYSLSIGLREVKGVDMHTEYSERR